MSWLNDYFPKENVWQDFRQTLMTITNNMSDQIQIGKYLNLQEYLSMYINT